MKIKKPFLNGTIFLFSIFLFYSLIALPSYAFGEPAGDDQIFTTRVPPSVMLVMSKDHKLYYEAYTDYSDLNEDGTLDTTYDHSIDYYGYFDSGKCYSYDKAKGRFTPTRVDTKCDQAGEWSGNFLNWATMARIDTLRKALYGGYRSIDVDGLTVLERTFIPQDAHSWVKVYSPASGVSTQPPINELTPYSGMTTLSICNTTLSSYNNPPVMRVANGQWLRWASNERWQCACDGEHPDDDDTVIPDPVIELLDEFNVRVEVCVPGLINSEQCRQYGNGNVKPIGLLQSFGETDSLYFGLITGSYQKNISGGVLRKNIGSITDEIDLNSGRFTGVPGIIETINKIRIVNYDYGSGDYSILDSCPPGLGVNFTEGNCTNWGNPIGEMYYEALRYLAGKTNPTAAFAGNDGSIIQGLQPVAWKDPYNNTNFCSKPYILVISDLSPDFDSDQVPGSYFNPSFTGDLVSSGLTDLELETNVIGNYENLSGNYFVGQKGAVSDGLCTEKGVNRELGEVRGLCPEEPGRYGSYYLAGLAHWAKIHDLRTDLSDSGYEQTVNTYSVALTSPLPEIKIQVGNEPVSLIPACYNFTDHNNAALVNFRIISQTATSGEFYLNWEDSEQGSDYDMDVDGILSFNISGNQITISVELTNSSTPAEMEMGYIINGTDQDGAFFLADNKKPLPDRVQKTHTVGVNPPPAPASLLKDPLWYAAKWGGFNDLDDDGIPNLPSEWDEDTDGVPDNYHLVTNSLDLAEQLMKSFRDMIGQGVSHVAPVVPVDVANRTQSGDKIYMASFNPIPNDYWQGNLKKYGLDLIPRTDCNRTEPELTVVDKNGTPAFQCDGTFEASSISYWSTVSDGGVVNKGGAGEVMVKNQLPTKAQIDNLSLSPDQFHGFRNLYTYKSNSNQDGSLTPFKRGQISRSDLNTADDLIRDRVINFMYGYTYDTQPSSSGVTGYPVAKRDWILGDIVHSEPRVIDYFDANGILAHRFIVAGSNDGMLHVFTDKQITLKDNKTYAPGEEIFAFIPGDLLTSLVNICDPNSHVYMVDGSANLYRASTQIADGSIYDGYYHKTLVFGERRGGRSYWALDVSKPDPLEWKVKWHIQGGSSGVTTPVTQRIGELGYTWNKPFFTTLQIGNNTKEVMIFAGGYDPDIEDGFPEEFADANDNGIWDQGEIHIDTPGGITGSYDLYNPGADSMGRGIFVVDLADGTTLFKATYAGGGYEVTTGNNQLYAAMKYCFPADMSIIPFSETELIIYAADIYGQIWKILYLYNAQNQWTIKRVFTANPGSDMETGNVDWFLGQTGSGPPNFNTADAGRKTFYSPDIAYFGNEWTAKPVLYVGTGDRAHPNYRMVKNRFYVVADYDAITDETQLLNLTCGELNPDADVNGDGVVDGADDQIRTNLTNLLYDGSARGFYRILSDQGNCTDDSTDHTGEHVLSKPILYFGNVYFTSYQPVYGPPCNPMGNIFIYAIDYSFGTSALNYSTFNDTTKVIRNVSDSYLKISGNAIPSGVNIITRGGLTAGLISAGGAISGAGEGQTTKVPGPSGGVTQIIWETGE